MFICYFFFYFEISPLRFASVEMTRDYIALIISSNVRLSSGNSIFCCLIRVFRL